ARLLCTERRPHSGRGERLCGRALSSPAELDRAGVSQARLLQEARQRRPLRGVGTAGPPSVGSARGVQVVTVVQRSCGGRRAWRTRPPPCVFTSRIRSRGNEKK